MMNVFSKPVVNGSFNIKSVLKKRKAEALCISDDDENATCREEELEALRNEYYEKGRKGAAEEFAQMADEIKKEAYEEGYHNGKNETTQEFESKYNSMKTIFDKWNEDKMNFLKELESDAVELAVAIERKIVGYEIRDSKEPLRHAVKEAMAMISDQKNLRLRVSCEDAGYFKHGAVEFIKTFGEEIEVVADSNMGNGGCVIETNIGNVDARAETRWNLIAETLFAGIERSKNDLFKKLSTEIREGEIGTVCGKSDQDSGTIS